MAEHARVARDQAGHHAGTLGLADRRGPGVVVAAPGQLHLLGRRPAGLGREDRGQLDQRGTAGAGVGEPRAAQDAVVLVDIRLRVLPGDLPVNALDRLAVGPAGTVGQLLRGHDDVGAGVVVVLPG